MEIEKLYKKLSNDLSEAYIKYSIISITHLNEIKNKITDIYQKGLFDEVFFEERMQFFDYRIPTELPNAQSIIITAIRQPKISVTFHIKGENYKTLIPPTYSYTTDKLAFEVISNVIKRNNYTLLETALPAKLLSVCGGLTKYGKNNISYISSWGSFFRLKIFISDIPCLQDNWQEFEVMDICKQCKACLIKCPTHAIVQDRFLIHAERCLTFLNEKSDKFPDWLKTEWNNALIGCMVCQDICPLNKRNKNWIEEGESFSEAETIMILDGVSKQNLPLQTQQKLKRLYLFDEYPVLKRNLQALLKCANRIA